MKKIKYGLLSLLAIIGVASCDRNDYEYIPATDAGQASVSFPVDTETEVELKSDETEFNVLLTRTTSESKESLTLPLYASGDLTNEDGSVVYLEVPNSVTFEKDADSAYVAIKANKEAIGYDNELSLTLSLDTLNSSYSYAKINLKVSYPAPWTSLGKGKMCDVFMAGNVYVDVEIQQNDLDPSLFRVVRPYHALCVPGEYEVSKDVCEYLQLQIVKGKFSYDFVYFPPSSTGYFHSKYGEDIYAVSPGSFQSLFNEETCAYNRVAEYQSEGLPGEIILEPMYYLMEQGGYFNKPGKEPLIDIIFPGYVKADYSADVKYAGVMTDAAGKTFAVADLALGEDVEDARAIVVPEIWDFSEVAQAVLVGELEATEVEAGRIEVPFDFEELQENKLQIIVLVVAKGEVKTVDSESFEYYGGGANPWKSIGTGLYTDDFLTPMFYDPTKVPTPTYEVEIMENTETPGLYRVMDPYSNSVYPYAEDDCAPDGMYLVINATNPNQVYIPKQSIGFDWGYGEMSIQSYAAYFLEGGAASEGDLAAAGYFGKVENGVITLPLLTNNGNPVSALLYCGNDVFLTGSAGEFKIVLPSAVPANQAAKAAAKRTAAKSASAKRAAKRVRKAKLNESAFEKAVRTIRLSSADKCKMTVSKARKI